MKPYGSKRSYDTEPRIKSGRALVKREGEAEIEEGREIVFGRGQLCEICAEIEIDMAFECYDREKAAKAKGEAYECTCPLVKCSH